MRVHLINLLVSLCLVTTGCQAYVRIQGKQIFYNNTRVYLSGANIAWRHLGNDFGNGKFWGHRAKYNEWFAGIQRNGGNTARVWVHTWGDKSPAMDGNGYVTGTDRQNSLVKELAALLDDAAKNNILVVLVLFHSRIFKKNSGLANDDKKMQSYIDKALKPMVEGLRNKRALAAWELMNEPEGGFNFNHNEQDKHDCFDLKKHFQKSMGPKMGWESKMPMKRIWRWFNWMADAIHNFDSHAVVTVGTWNWQSNSDKCWGCHNIYKDECFIRAGGRAKGKLDFYQMHTYEWNDQTPIKKNADFYALNKPLVVGEFSVKNSGTKDAAKVYKHYYFNGYAGAWGWQYNDHHDNEMDSRDTINKGLQAIRNEKSHGLVKIKL